MHCCRVDDGGYFFARIAPGSLLDSCYAVKTLSLVGESPEYPEAFKTFVLSHVDSSSKHDIHALYLASEILKELGDANGLSEIAAGFNPAKDLRLIAGDSSIRKRERNTWVMALAISSTAYLTERLERSHLAPGAGALST